MGNLECGAAVVAAPHAENTKNCHNETIEPEKSRACNSTVECLPYTEEVKRSNRFRPTNLQNKCISAKKMRYSAT
jgi:hypothetical protein